MEAPHRRGWLAVFCVVLLALAVPASLLAADPAPTAETSTAPGDTTTTEPATSTSATTTVPTTTTSPTTTVPPQTTTTPPTQTFAAAPGTGQTKSGASVSIVDGPSNSDFGYSPSAVSITAGDTVTWTNNGTTPVGHNVASADFNSGTLHNGQSYSRVFTTPGTVNYVCTIHPFMKGTVTVAAAPSSPDNGSGDGNGANPTGSSTPTPTDSGGTAPTDPTSESTAGTLPTAAGTSSTLPQTGLDLLALGLVGGLLLAAGLRLRRA
jgi:plastocyanin